MHKLFLLVSLVYSVSLESQVVLFSDAMSPAVPGTLITINDELFVAAIVTDSDLNAIPFDEPNQITTVSEYVHCGIGLWKMAYHESANTIYAYDSCDSQLTQIDLNSSYPIVHTDITQMPYIVSGMTIHQNILYLAIRNEIYTYDINSGGSDIVVYYTDPDSEVTFVNPVVYQNEIIFGEQTSNGGSYVVSKLPVGSSNPTKTLVSDLEEITGAIQSSYLLDNYVYYGIELFNDHKIIRINLNDSIPLEPEVVMENIPGAPLGLTYFENSFYVSEGNTYTIVTFENPNLEIDQFDYKKAFLHPNPSSERVFLSEISLEINSYELYNVQGQKILEGSYSNNGIDISNLALGLYFLNVTSEGTKQTLKFIKE